MNEKRNDRQQGGAGRDQGMKREKEQNPDRTRTGQVGADERREDTARQGQRGAQKGGLDQQKPGRNPQEEIE